MVIFPLLGRVYLLGKSILFGESRSRFSVTSLNRFGFASIMHQLPKGATFNVMRFNMNDDHHAVKVHLIVQLAFRFHRTVQWGNAPFQLG